MPKMCEEKKLESQHFLCFFFSPQNQYVSFKLKWVTNKMGYK